MQKRDRLCVLAVLALGLLGVGGAEGQRLEEALGTKVRTAWQNESRQYDFWIGDWDVEWRSKGPDQLYPDSVGARARHWLFPVLDGKALIELAEDWYSEGMTPAQRTFGFSIRYYDTNSDRWVMAQDWPSPNTGGLFADQLTGRLHHGRIELFSSRPGEDGQRGTRRYTFSDVHADRYRWDQSTTRDGGTTWVFGNMALGTRIGAEAELGHAGEPLPNHGAGDQCSGESFERFRVLQGSWVGEETTEEGVVSTVSFVGTSFNGGCAVLGVLTRQTDGYRRLQAWTYNPQVELLGEFRLDNRSGTPHTYFLGRDSDDLILEENDQIVIESELSYRPPVRPRPDPPRRTRWVTMEPSTVRIIEETRMAPEEPWRMVSTLDLRRQS